MKKMIAILLSVAMLLSVGTMTVAADEASDIKSAREKADHADYFYGGLCIDYVRDFVCGKLVDENSEDFNKETYTHTYPAAEVDKFLQSHFVFTDAMYAEVRTELGYDEAKGVYELPYFGGKGGFINERDYVSYVKNGNGSYTLYYETINWEELPEGGYDKLDQSGESPDEFLYEGKVYKSGPDGYLHHGGYKGGGLEHTFDIKDGVARFISTKEYTGTKVTKATTTTTAGKQPTTTAGKQPTATAGKQPTATAGKQPTATVGTNAVATTAASATVGKATTTLRTPLTTEGKTPTPNNQQTVAGGIEDTTTTTTATQPIVEKEVAKTEGLVIKVADDVFPQDAVITVEKVEESAPVYETVEIALEPIAEKFVAYEITAEKDKVAVQPNGTVTATFVIPDGFDVDKTVVLHVADDGEVEQLQSTVDPQLLTITVTLTHFSTYVVAESADDSKDDGVIDMGSPEDAEPKGGFPWWIVIVAVVVLAGGGAAAWYFLIYKKK